MRGEGWERKTCEREISFRDDEEGSSGEKEKGEKKKRIRTVPSVSQFLSER